MRRPILISVTWVCSGQILFGNLGMRYPPVPRMSYNPGLTNPAIQLPF